MTRRRRKPAYLLHKATVQARVRINGRDHYLGKYGSPESRVRYDELILEFFSTGNCANAPMLVGELSLLYLDFCKTYYLKNGEPTGETNNIGVTETGSEFSLTQEELEALPTNERESRHQQVKKMFLDAGAHLVLKSVAELPSVIQSPGFRS